MQGGNQSAFCWKGTTRCFGYRMPQITRYRCQDQPLLNQALEPQPVSESSCRQYRHGYMGCDRVPLELLLCATVAGTQLVKPLFRSGFCYVLSSIWSTKQNQPLHLNKWKGLHAKKQGLLCCFCLGCNWSVNAGAEQQCPVGFQLWKATTQPLPT